ncbi:MAG: phosphate ABC transporter substrate-binding protein PstS [Microcoleaceae cyanobacterium]
MVTASAVAVAVTVGTVGQAVAQTLNGAGASFHIPLYERYFSEFKKETGVTVNYNSIGSGGGIKQFIADSVDFAGTDAPPKSGEISQMKNGMIMVPTAGGAVAVAYNVSGINDLRLSREALGKIFAGEVKTWNQVDSSYPNKPIKVVVRADSSGTTFIFTRHLSTISSAFKSKVGTDKAPKWPSGFLSGPKNDGVAAVIKQTDGAIGYVQDTFARQNNIKTAKIQNKAGQFVEPSLAAANAAMSGVQFDSSFNTTNIQDPPSGYPIVGITWLLVKKQYDNAQTAAAVKRMVNWVLTKGQSINGQLEYTRIPQAVATKANQTVNTQVAAK